MKPADSHENALDWLRWGAAVAVLLHHLTPFAIGRSALPHAYLAVDLFFLISGFVVTRRYESSLCRGTIGAKGFIVARVVRLAPLLLLAALASALEAVLRKRFGSTLSQVPSWQIALAIATTLFTLPTVPTPALGLGNWPLDPPLWSLFFELLVGVLAAPWLLRMPRLMVTGIAALAAITLAHGGLAAGSIDGGPFLASALMATARIVFSFCLGLLMHRATESRPRIPVVVPCAVGVAALLLQLGIAQPGAGAVPVVIDLAFVFLAWPALLWTVTRPRAPRMPRALFLADLSYALYVLHWPVMFLCRELARARGWMMQDTPWTTGLIGIGTLAVACAGVLLWERPMRTAWRTRGTPRSR